VTSFSVPPGSLDLWRRRLGAHGVNPIVAGVSQTPAGEDSIAVVDPSGLVIALVEARDERPPWTGGGVDAASAIRGLHSVTMTIRSPAPTIDFLRSLLGFETTHDAAGRFRLEVNGGGPGRVIDIVQPADAPAARNGLGTVHHVAFAVPTEADQLAIREEVGRRGVNVTPVLDRQYFRSIYFREPGGVLLEVATIAPGFAVDEEPAHLGEALKLPPWEEPNRVDIEAGLPPVVQR
jgi:glyoxalase family protein